MAKDYRVRDERRDVKVYLSQQWKDASADDVRRVLREAVGVDLIVISEVQREVARVLVGELAEQAATRRQFIVLGRGVGTTTDGRTANQVAIYTPDGRELLQDKLSLSQWDLVQEPPVEPGSELIVHSSGQLRFVVLNCHDYTHASLIHDMVTLDVDAVVVVAANQAAQMFMEYAKADAHRLFAYVILCNVAEVGGSAVCAPFMSRTQDGLEGKRGELSMGGVQFEARGRAHSVVQLGLAIPELRAMRERYRHIDPDDPKAIRRLPTSYKAIAPPESVTYARPPYRAVVTRLREGGGGLDDIALPDRRPEERQRSGVWRLAIAQLRSAGLRAYLSTRYVPSAADEGKLLAAHLTRLLNGDQGKGAASDLAGADLVVFPEVFLPIHADIDGKQLDAHLRDFSTRTGAIVVGGIEYEPEAVTGANRVRIYVPDHDPIDYLKLTRSQYDARDVDRTTGAIGSPFAMTRGDRLVRIAVGESLSFGVLTCLDFSHLELVHALNTVNRPRRRVAVPAVSAVTGPADGPVPLDLMIVPCFNPFGALYAELARSDAHRYYQYVTVCNVAEHGESGVFGPELNHHPRRTLIQAGKDVVTVLRVDLPIGELRAARDEMSDDQIAAARRADRDAVARRRTFHRKPGLLTDGERACVRDRADR